MKRLVVKAEKGLKATVTSDAVKLPTLEVIEEKLQERTKDVVKLLSGIAIADPAIKFCSRCIRMRRVNIRPIEQFSILQTGKYGSQCKICKAEQSKAWCEKNKDHRAAYYATKRAAAKLLPKQPKAEPKEITPEVQAIIDEMKMNPMEGMENVLVFHFE